MSATAHVDAGHLVATTTLTAADAHRGAASFRPMRRMLRLGPRWHRVELTFALILVAASGGVVLALGLAERRRTTAIALALGAKRRQVRGIVLSEAAVLAVGGVVAGTLLAVGLTQVLVEVLTGVFDPPPDTVTVPWTYLAATATVAVAALGAAVAGAVRHGRRPALTVLRDL